nr:unnamed protein product [Callosobruchus chinensis]
MTAVLQINLHHSRAATATLCQKILADDIGVVLIQEPWTVKGSDGYEHREGDIAVTKVHLQTGSAGRHLKLRNMSSSIVLPCAEEETRIWKLSRRREDRST